MVFLKLKSFLLNVNITIFYMKEIMKKITKKKISMPLWIVKKVKK